MEDSKPRKVEEVNRKNFKDIFNLVANNKEKAKLIDGKPDGTISKE